MTWLKRFLIIVWLLAVLIFGAWFLEENTTEVQLSLLGFALPSVSLGLLVSVTLLGGLLLGLLVSFISLEPRLLMCKRELKKAKKELVLLRSAKQQEP